MPKKSISSLDLYKLTSELSFLNGGFIRGVKSEKNALYLLIYHEGEHWIKIRPGDYIAVTKEKPHDAVEFPFTSKIKSELLNKRVLISMHGADRIIEIGSDTAKLIIELFSNGNIVLVKEGVIEQAMFNRNYGTRMVATGEKFLYPPGGVNVFEIDFDGFHNTISNSDKSSIVKTLAVDLSLGGVYAEEIVYRSGLDKTLDPHRVGEAELVKLYDCLKSIISETPHPNIIGENILSVIDLKHVDWPRRYFDTISDAILAFFAETAPKETTRSEKNASETGKALEEYSAAVELLENNFSDVSKLIGIARDSKTGLNERMQELERSGWILEGRFLCKLPDKRISIDITKPLRQTMSEYYEKIKKLKRAANKIAEIKVLPKRIKPKLESAWYAKFRWCFTSEGNLVVLGRDNSQNIALINRHVERDDLIMHADVFGSPFCVIKPNKNHSISEASIREAASLVASYSSAWKSGAGSLDVYWVKPTQVTKSPPSGESLKKGAFYIEGKREYIKKAPLKVYIRILVHQNEYEALVLPYKPEEGFVLITPGNKRREELISKIIKLFSERARIILERDSLDRLIPQGKATLEKINTLLRMD